MVMVTWAELLEPTTRAFLPFHEASFSVELLCTISPLQHTKHSRVKATTENSNSRLGAPTAVI